MFSWVKQRTTFANVASVVAVFLALSGGALAGSSWKHSSAHKKFTVVERATTDFVGDVTPSGDSVGDTLGFANQVYNKANKKLVGTDNGYCIRTAVGKTWECNWTLRLTGGQITVEGPFNDVGDTTLAVTGGTGKYSNVSGSMLLHARSDGASYDFTYNVRY